MWHPALYRGVRDFSMRQSSNLQYLYTVKNEVCIYHTKWCDKSVTLCMGVPTAIIFIIAGVISAPTMSFIIPFGISGMHNSFFTVYYELLN